MSIVLINKCNIIIDSLIAKEFRDEAKEIIKLTNNKNRKDFIDYYNHDQGNVCCLVLDFAKDELIIKKKIVFNTKNRFGNPF